MLILGSSNSKANEDMSKIWINGDTIIFLSRKHCGKWRNCLLSSNFTFSHNVFKSFQTCLPPTSTFRNICHENQEHQKFSGTTMLQWLPHNINRAQVSAAMNKIVMNLNTPTSKNIIITILKQI